MKRQHTDDCRKEYTVKNDDTGHNSMSQNHATDVTYGLTAESVRDQIRRELDHNNVAYSILTQGEAENNPINKSSSLTLTLGYGHRWSFGQDSFPGWDVKRIKHEASVDQIKITFTREQHRDADMFDGTGIWNSESVSWLCDECGRGLRTPIDVVHVDERPLCHDCR